MNATRPPRTRVATRRDALEGAVARVLSSSLILYLLAVLAHKTWIILNSDVALLLKRAH
jgi:hypothetical protein